MGRRQDADLQGQDADLLEQEVWVPDTLVYEKIDATDGTPSQDVSMSSTGDAFLSVPRVQTISCRMELESFP